NEVGVSLALGESAIRGTTAGGGTDPTAMGANAAAASDVMRLYVRMGTVMLLGSLAQPRKVRFEFERCVSVGTVMPEVASASDVGVAENSPKSHQHSVPEVASASGGGGGAVDALLLWDVFLGDALFQRTVCDAVQLFASPDCSGAAAAEYQNTVYHTRDMSAFKMDTSVKSIRCVLDYICSRVKCPAHSTCIKTNDSMEVACQCAQGYREVYGKCKPQEPSTE
ncbi:unnamed protein product, partial [Closterium sp. Naga37s-1]